MSATETTTPKAGFRFPFAFTLLFTLIVLVATLTWIIPAGKYAAALHDWDGNDQSAIARITPEELEFTEGAIGPKVIAAGKSVRVGTCVEQECSDCAKLTPIITAISPASQ